jgi:hypothetical protein
MTSDLTGNDLADLWPGGARVTALALDGANGVSLNF